MSKALKPKKRADRWFLAIVVTTVLFGFFVFMSAALGLYARDGATFSSVMQTQIIGVLSGFIFLIIASNIPYTFWRRMAMPIFVISTILMAVVLLPNVGFLHGGSSRWIYLGPLSFQPADLYKIAVVILYAALIAKHKKNIANFKYAVIPLLIIFGISGLLLILQPKIGTLVVIAITMFAMFITSGARAKHIALLLTILLPVLIAMLFLFPYARERIDTFLNPSENTMDESYQIQQSLIAVGSGGVFGRGYGQSIQKFSFLPEPISDSVFAVAAEEFGFIGGVIIIALVTLFTYRGLIIAIRAPDLFARLLVLGLVILISSQSFINIAAMIGLAPLTGMPLVFISHGGTAMLTALGSVGIILNVSKYSKQNS
ncbi:MAG: putative peptidoglycan glycosyltransferase FtsW [Candidatus Campbellbacteria bacterium]|nr:putative peptidoglycan glycosyltransferase FtsW [Candidatus Campbellbacteria bacterium]